MIPLSRKCTTKIHTHPDKENLCKTTQNNFYDDIENNKNNILKKKIFSDDENLDDDDGGDFGSSSGSFQKINKFSKNITIRRRPECVKDDLLSLFKELTEKPRQVEPTNKKRKYPTPPDQNILKRRKIFNEKSNSPEKKTTLKRNYHSSGDLDKLVKEDYGDIVTDSTPQPTPTSNSLQPPSYNPPTIKTTQSNPTIKPTTSPQRPLKRESNRFSPFQRVTPLNTTTPVWTHRRKRERLSFLRFDNFNFEDQGFFFKIPNEILLIIFSFFWSCRDLCMVACVSKRWLSLSKDPILWKPLYLRNFGQPLTSLPIRSWKQDFLKKKSENHLQQISQSRSYSKKGSRNPISNSILEGQQTKSITFGNPLVFRKVLSENDRLKKRGNGVCSSFKENEALIDFLRQKKEFFDSFDTTSLATTPAK